MKNNNLIAIKREMKANSQGKKYKYCHPIFERPTEDCGYFNLLETAAKLKTFTWSDLMLASKYCDTIIDSYRSIKSDYERHGWNLPNRYTSLRNYMNNYNGDYRAYFKTNGLITGHGMLSITSLGKALVKELRKQIKNKNK